MLSYDADCEAPLWGNCLVSVTGPNVTAPFVYDGDGRQVKSTITPLSGTGSATTLHAGQHYEVTDGVVTKYYFAGAQRIALRKDGVLNFIIGDHLGSTSLVTDDAGNVLSELLYKACPTGMLTLRVRWREGEVRHESGASPTEYTYTGQYSYTADFGLMFYNARWYDPSLGRFAQADSIIPSTQGVQGLDRYAYVNNNPVRYTDPTGHFSEDEIIEHLKYKHGSKWEKFLKAWKSDALFWRMLLKAEIGDTLLSPTTELPMGRFVASDKGSFSIEAEGLGLEVYQGYGPYVLIRKNNIAYHSPEYEFSNDHSESWIGGTGWSQPIWDYSSGEPVFTNTSREVRFDPVIGYDSWNPDWGGGAGIPWLVSGGGGALIKFFGSAAGPAGLAIMIIGGLGYVSNSVLRFDAPLSVSVVPSNLNAPSLPSPPDLFPGPVMPFP
jgi:RHS repeat-associated protein